MMNSKMDENKFNMKPKEGGSYEIDTTIVNTLEKPLT